jgi:UDP:flavonoid glycosyltransferase YjiC (YdhE family)
MRLLFTATSPLSHITPMLPLAVAARDRGHEVLFVTAPGAEHFPQAVGLLTRTNGTTWPGMIRRYQEAFAGAAFAGLSPEKLLDHFGVNGVIRTTGAELTEGLLPLIAEWKPDLVVTNPAAIHAVMASAVAGVPAVVHSYSPPSALLPRVVWPAMTELLSSRWGVTPPPVDEIPYLDIWPAALAPGDADPGFTVKWPLRHDHVLPAAERPPRPTVLDGLPYDRTVYATIGTTYNTAPGVLETLVEALHGEGVNVIATVGQGGDRERFGTQPEYVRIEEFVPQRQLLPYVEVVVCHAGAASVLGAVAHGVPVVMAPLPLASDQYLIAEFAASGGVGLAVGEGDFSQGAVREAFRKVVGDPSFRTSAHRVAALMAAMPAPGDVVDRLTAYASPGTAPS